MGERHRSQIFQSCDQVGDDSSNVVPVDAKSTQIYHETHLSRQRPPKLVISQQKRLNVLQVTDCVRYLAREVVFVQRHFRQTCHFLEDVFGNGPPKIKIVKNQFFWMESAKEQDVGEMFNARRTSKTAPKSTHRDLLACPNQLVKLL